jgi:LPS-assembly protein
MFKKIRLSLLYFFGLWGFSNAGYSTHIPVDIQAETLTYNAQENKLIACGKVDLQEKTSQGNRRLTCAKLVYDIQKGTIKAFSSKDQKVIFTDKNGDVFTSHSLDLSDDFKNGVIQSLTLFTTQKATLHSEKASRQGLNTNEKDDQIIMTLDNADYTACELCKNKNPIWQLKAKKVEHDSNSKTIEYTNAHLEIKGVPVFYTPYFSHPDPTVKRKSGILAPLYGHNDDLGYIIGVPFYYAASDQRDVMITPIVTTKQSDIIQGEFRNRFDNGMFTANGSYTRSRSVISTTQSTSIPDGPQLPSRERWNFIVKTRRDINENHLIFADINRASDTTYLPRYSLIRQTPFVNYNNNLRSNITWQRFSSESFADLQTYAFQTDAQETTPFILPKGRLHIQSNMPTVGGTFEYDANILAMFRDKDTPGRYGTHTYRVSNGFKWKKPWILPYGQLLALTLESRADVYFTKNYYYIISQSQNAAQKNSHHRHIRFFPQGSLDWSYPLQKRIEKTNWVINPRVSIISSPLNINNRHIPNEDSNSFELDDLTLFIPNRFDGIDRVDVGSRMVGGIENEFKFPDNRNLKMFLGQSVRLDNQNVAGFGYGENHKKSDIIASILANPSSYVSARYRVSYAHDFNNLRYSELGLSLGKPIFKITGAYVYLDKQSTPTGNTISQANMQLSSAIHDNWRLAFGQIRNLRKNAGGAALATYLSAAYEDECFILELGAYKSTKYDRDIRPETSILLRLNFKTLSNLVLSSAPTYPHNQLTAGL